MEKTHAERMIESLRYYVAIRKKDIWVRRSELKAAEEELIKMQKEGTIKKATMRPEWSCNGSVNFLMEYPEKD